MSVHSDILAALVDHALHLGVFEQVNGSEPDSPPGGGLAYAVGFEGLEPSTSGLASTSTIITFKGTIFKATNTMFSDDAETLILETLDTLLAYYTNNFTLNVASVRSIDLLGIDGAGVTATGAWTTIDGTHYRIIDITIPVIVNDAWEQTP